MTKEGYGKGRVASKQELKALRRTLGLDVQKPINLNSASLKDMAAHPLISKRVAAQIVNLRERQPIRTPAELYRANVINEQQLNALGQVMFGTLSPRPTITNIATETSEIYVDEPFSVQIEFISSALLKAEIISIDVRFPSGKTGLADFSISEEDRSLGHVTLGEFVSVEAGEFHLFGTLRDEAGNIHHQTATFGVFTRNPVRMYVAPSYWTQSGNVGAPKFDFGLRRWECFASVRWVNSNSFTVNLGRTVTVVMSDAGTQIGSFSFNLSSDIIIPPTSTIYGNLSTWHTEGSAAFNVFHAKGDLTYQYSMSGSGFTPTTNQIWRTMRVIGYNIIRVGDFNAAERNEYQRAAAEIASNIFRSRDMTVYGTELYRIEGTSEMDADKERFRFIDSQDEINVLRNKYTVNNWFLDVFFVEGRWDGAFGSSPTDGSVNKEGNNSGLVVRRDSDTINLGQTFAHESGHYFGLEHADTEDGCSDTQPSDPNISDNFIFSSSRRDSDFITLCQIDKMRKHGLVRSLTP